MDGMEAQGLWAGAGWGVRETGFTGRGARSGVFLVHVSRLEHRAPEEDEADPAATAAQEADAITAEAGASCETRSPGDEPGG